MGHSGGLGCPHQADNEDHCHCCARQALALLGSIQDDNSGPSLRAVIPPEATTTKLPSGLGLLWSALLYVSFITLTSVTTLAYASGGQILWPAVLFLLLALGQGAAAAVVAADTETGGRGWIGTRYVIVDCLSFLTFCNCSRLSDSPLCLLACVMTHRGCCAWVCTSSGSGSRLRCYGCCAARTASTATAAYRTASRAWARA